ncbi:hypothetical protein [Mesorhizobium sp. M1348]|uniref:hypothetical protein n=1 Tax=Mesorhizobium sp. M1348 TaxID=2957089 RepID=UPI0033380F1A
MIDDELDFWLVPWSPSLHKQLGDQVVPRPAWIGVSEKAWAWTVGSGAAGRSLGYLGMSKASGGARKLAICEQIGDFGSAKPRFFCARRIGTDRASGSQPKNPPLLRARAAGFLQSYSN